MDVAVCIECLDCNYPVRGAQLSRQFGFEIVFLRMSDAPQGPDQGLALGLPDPDHGGPLALARRPALGPCARP
jgi:hypothetical protein